MKKIHWLVFRSFIGPFSVVFFIALFVLLMQFMWRYIDELVGKGLDFMVVAEFLLYTSATLVPSALPLAILMSSLMTFGNLGEKYELTAMKASGMSLQRIMSPMIIMIVFVSFAEFFFVNEVMPYSNLKLYSLLHDIRNKQPAVHIQEGEFYPGINNYSIRVNRKDPETNKLYDIIIYDHTKGHNLDVTIADSGLMEVTADEANIIFTLYHGYKYLESQDFRKPFNKRTYPHQYVEFSEQKFVIDLVGYDLERSDGGLFKDHQAMLDIKQLKIYQDSIDGEIQNVKDKLHDELINTNIYFRASANNKGERAGIKSNNVNNKAQMAVSVTNPPADSRKMPVLKTEVVVADTVNNRLRQISPDSLLAIMSPSDRTKIYYAASALAKKAQSRSFNSVPSVNFKTSKLRRFEIEWHRKFVLSAACLIFLFLGAPLGAIIRKGGLGLPMVLSTLFFIFWYITNLTTEKMVRESILNSVVGMWMPSALFFIIGVFLTYKATTDSQMMNMDTYANFLKKIFGQRYRLVDVLLKEIKESTGTTDIKLSNLQQSLKGFLGDVDQQLDIVKNQIKPAGFFISIFGAQESTHLTLFERLYKNIFRTILKSKLFHDRPVRAKIEEFPNFSANLFIDSGYKFIIKIAMLLFPVVAAIVLSHQKFLITLAIVAAVLIILRHYILLLTLRNRLLAIKQHTGDLYKIINQADT